MEIMNILVTGGTGFLGQHLVKELSGRNNKITVLCRKKRYGEYIDVEKLADINVFYRNDVTDYEKIEKYFEKKDIVFNLAGCVSFKQKDKEKLIKINYEGTLNVLKACEKHKVKKLIHISSTAALGFCNKIIDESHEFDWKKHKKCVYGYSKHLPDRCVYDSKIETVIVHPPLILGPGDNTNTRKFLESIKQKKIPFNPPGRNSVIDVRDLVTALVLIMERDVKNEKFIISGENYSFKEMNEKIASVIGVRPPSITLPKIFKIPMINIALLMEKVHKDSSITYENILLAFQNRMYDNKKIAGLGFYPKYTFEQTIKDSWEWMTGINNE